MGLRKNLSVEKGERALFDDVRYFFYISNQEDLWPEGVVGRANGRCNQENLIEQLKNGARAMEMPVGDLVSNGAYMVMASLAWTLKAWLGLLLPEKARGPQSHGPAKPSVLKMEFKRFVNAFMLVPCQIVRQSRRIVYRLLAWNPWLEVLLRGVDVLHSLPTPAVRPPMRC